jgi:hypothetical protein
MSLLPADQERVKFHLGYSEAVPDGDFALLQRRMTQPFTNEYRALLVEQIARCTRVFAQTELNRQETGVFYNRIIGGDINRNDREDRPEPRVQRLKAYITECDQLALSLGVLNFRNPANAHLLHFGVVRQ